MERVLVVAAHSDDETLGCGGAIRKHREVGDAVFALSLTDGVSSRTSVDSNSSTQRLQAAHEAASVLGFDWVTHGDFPDNAMDSVPILTIIQFIEEHARTVQPTLIYTHHCGDLNIDHRMTNQAVLAAFRPQPQKTVQEVRAFEVPSSTEWSFGQITTPFMADLYVDITNQWDAKELALNAYASEMRPAPHTRSIEAIRARATLRGAEVGVKMAEGFQTIWRVA